MNKGNKENPSLVNPNVYSSIEFGRDVVTAVCANTISSCIPVAFGHFRERYDNRLSISLSGRYVELVRDARQVLLTLHICDVYVTVFCGSVTRVIHTNIRLNSRAFNIATVVGIQVSSVDRYVWIFQGIAYQRHDERPEKHHDEGCDDIYSNGPTMGI